MKHRILPVFLLFILFSCQTQVDSEDVQTGWEIYNLSGKVKRLEKREGVVVQYKFGEPVFEQEATTIIDFNEFGFVTNVQTNSTKEYEYKVSERTIFYSNKEKGLKKQEKFKGTYYGDTEIEIDYFFQFDTLNNRQISEKTVNVLTGKVDLNVWEYNGKERKISKYNNENELVKMTIENTGSNPQTFISYSGDGEVEFEYYKFFNGKTLVKDSAIYHSNKRGSIYTGQYDKLGRALNFKRFEFDSDSFEINDDSETTYEYESESKISSFIQREFIDLKETIKSEYRFQLNLDELGNVIEEFKINMATNKIEEGVSYTIQYY